MYFFGLLSLEGRWEAGKVAGHTSEIAWAGSSCIDKPKYKMYNAEYWTIFGLLFKKEYEKLKLLQITHLRSPELVVALQTKLKWVVQRPFQNLNIEILWEFFAPTDEHNWCLLAETTDFVSIFLILTGEHINYIYFDFRERICLVNIVFSLAIWSCSRLNPVIFASLKILMKRWFKQLTILILLGIGSAPTAWKAGPGRWEARRCLSIVFQPWNSHS